MALISVIVSFSGELCCSHVVVMLIRRVPFGLSTRQIISTRQEALWANQQRTPTCCAALAMCHI